MAHVRRSTYSRPAFRRAERGTFIGPQWPDPEGPAAIRHGRLPGSTCRAGRLTGWLILTQSGPRILILKYWQKRASGPFAAGNFDYHDHAAIQTTQPGSMPFAFSTDAAAGAVSNFINALAASGSLELEAIPAAKMVYNCNSVGNGPRSSTPRTDTSSLA